EEDETENMLGFISSCKHKGLSVEDVLARCENAGSQALQAANIYAAYTKYLKSHALMDFDDLIETATSKLESLNRATAVRLNGKMCDLNDLKLICADEFQDTSRSFYELTKALMKKNPRIGLFCVGDDNQSICAYAGSNLDYFRHFETYFPGAKRAQLKTNFRSGSAIVEYANYHMRGCGEGGLAVRRGGSVEHLRISKYGSVHEIVRRLIVPERGHSVLVLARRNVSYGVGLEACQKDLSRLHPNVRVSTIHGAKGSEADTVFFLKEPIANGRMHYLNAVIGLTEAEVQAEESRIEYVALTRARGRLIVIE
ncbi:MAG: UvrD-helicase domain-containing protein, partial [Planctomycetota bacterium]